MTTGESTATARATFSPSSSSSSSAVVHHSPWHSPIPYLFGGLAAMLGLIAIALLMLACSYWRPSDGSERDVESGAAEKGESGAGGEALPVFEEKFLVIMAGELKPTFLATPASGKGSAVDGGRDESREKEENAKTKDESEAAAEFRDN